MVRAAAREPVTASHPIRDMVAVVPIRGFHGMTRLASAISHTDRQALSVALATVVVGATTGAGLRTLVVTGSPDVWSWAVDRGLSVCDEPGRGLSAAANAGVACSGDKPWMVIHADLPFATPESVAAVARASINATVIVPSLDGGTTVLCGFGRFPFSYGVGSFHRHLASAPNATVLVSHELSVDIDIPHHLASLPAGFASHYASTGTSEAGQDARR